jgi:hypothetical protein
VAVLAAALALGFSGAAAGGEARAKPDEVIHLGDEQPQGKVLGWVCSNDERGDSDHLYLDLKVAKLECRPDFKRIDDLREDVRKHGNLFG